MPVKASKKIEFAVGDEVIMDLEGKDVPATILKLKGDNYLVEDGEGTEYECEPHELKSAEKAAKSKAKPEPEADDEPPKKAAKKPAADEPEDDKPAKKSGGWSSVKPAAKKDIGLPLGSWEALAFDGGVTEKGKSVGAFIDLVGVNAEKDDGVNGVQQRKFYTIKDDKGGWNDEGIGYFKADLQDIGFSEEQIDGIDQDDLVEDLTKLLKKLRKMEPWVSIKVKKGKEGYPNNVYIQGPMDNQDNKPENPLVF